MAANDAGAAPERQQSHHGDTRQLHRALTALGYASPEHPNQATSHEHIESLLTAFQRDHGLEPTGIVDDQTAALLEPTAALARRLSREPHTIPFQAELAEFLTANPSFRLDDRHIAGIHEAHDAAGRDGDDPHRHDDAKD